MQLRRTGTLLSVVLLMLVASLGWAGTAGAVPGTPGKAHDVTLNGANEVPGPGDPDGSGKAQITVVKGQGQVCYVIQVYGIAPATAAHIHVGPAGEAGPVVVTLGTPDANGYARGCVAASSSLIAAINRNPSGYYVNVHNAEYPAGAIRGQLRT